MNQQGICYSIILKYKLKDMIKFWKKVTKKSKQRFYLMRQWMQTEENYLKDLQTIQKIILPALINQRIITQEQRWRLFPNLQQMQMLSQQMLKDITKFVKQWDVHKTVISDSVFYISKFFKIYKAYIINMTTVSQLMTKAGQQRAKEIRKIQNSLPKSEYGGMLSLNDYLIKPMQRLTKHRIVIQNYLRAMRNNHKDYQSLSKAFQKFEQVVQENNRDMILQQNTQKLIKLQQVYGDIILNTRSFLGQSVGYCTQGHTRIYMFNDMILATKCIDQNKLSSQVDIKKQELLMRIQIDSYSFVRAPLDGRYQINRLSITGIQETLDIVFSTQAQRNRCYQIMKNVIAEYYQKEKYRKEIIREVQTRRITAKRMSQNQNYSPTQFQTNFGAQSLDFSNHNKWKKTPFAQQKIKGGIKLFSKNSLDQITGCSKYRWTQQPKYQAFNLQFRFIGAEKRYSGSTLYYIFLIQTPVPVKIRQYIFLEYQQVQNLENYLRQLHSKSVPCPNIPTIDARPKGVNWEEYRNNPIKLVEFRAICLQRFLNYVFRNKKILERPQYPSMQIFMHEMMWSYITNHKSFQKCFCVWCVNFNFQKQEVQIEQFERIQFQYLDSRRKNKKWEQICPTYLFNLQTKLADQPISKNDINLERLLLIMHLKFHRLVSPFTFPKNKTISKQIQLLSLPIHILNRNPLNPNLKMVEVAVHRHTTVRDVIMQLQIQLQMQCLLDFQLCLMLSNDDQVYYLDQDEYIMEVSSKGCIQKDKQELNTQSSSRKPIGFFKSLQRTFSQIGESISGISKIHFYLKKSIVLASKVEIQACLKSQVRLNLIIGEIFYRYKHEKLTLNFNDMKFLCAVYYALKILGNNKEKQFQNIKKQDLYRKMDAQIFKGILTQKKWYFIDTNFLRQIAQILNNFRIQNLISRKTINALLIKLYQVILDKRSFQSQHIQIENTQPQSLPGSKQKLLAGVNRRFFTISRLGQLTPLIQIPLQRLQYKVTGLELYLLTQKREYHFRGNNVFTLNKYIQMYKIIEPVQKMSALRKEHSFKWKS